MATSSQNIIVKVNGQEFLVEVGDLNTSPVLVVVDGQIYEVIVGDQAAEPRSKPVTAVGMPQEEISPPPTFQEQPTTASAIVSGASVIAPLPGNIVDVKVQPGQQVRKGDPLCVIDAMKMNNVIRSPRDGRISGVEVSIGQLVDYGEVLITYE